MAGIGFVLRRLAKQDNLTGLAQAYTHSALAATGPWLFTVIALGVISAISGRTLDLDSVLNFRGIIIYNFCFSLVLTSPVFMVATRYLADSIYAKDVSDAPGLLIGSLLICYAFGFPLAIWFYGFHLDLPAETMFLAILNFSLVCAVWLVSIFLTALKDYMSITNAFGIGMLLAFILSAIFARPYGDTGMLAGFTMGIVYILGGLVARIFVEYPYAFKKPFNILPYFYRYWQVALGGLFYNMAVWVDKWVMWFSPQSETLSNGLVMYPNYDSAMFLAYLTIVPSMAIFIFSIETTFFEEYLKFYRDIQNKATYKKIERNHQGMVAVIFGSARNFIVLQGSVCLLAIFMAPQIFDLLRINYLQLGIFRYGVLGALFHVLSMFLLILLSYFDNRRDTLLIQFMFFAMNGIFTYASMQFGFEYYGYGYFLSSALTFVISGVVIARYVMRLPYHTFITTNSSLR
ncbi:MAG: exopolysaccharide Pel transporter PelG [Hyphomicrobiales bacterium]|nr:exopolysaccharide Pel transporter PelG [Hyphomicrobiales bacterium]